MAHYTDTPPGYDYVVPPRVFAPLPNSGPRSFLGDNRSLLATGTSEWVSSRINLGQPALPTYQESNLGREPVKQQSWWKNFGQVFNLRSRKRQASQPNWKPVSLRTPFLLAIALVSLALVAVLQWLLLRSQRNGGIIFAANINSLPLSTTFLYLYLPTVIAVVFGFLWNWIDLDVRRIEPFLQLAKDEGATGRESLLLHYPVDFLASVPVKAFKSKHWPVFTASLATVFVFWGITPVQSGIFATDTLTKIVDMPSIRSTSFLSISDQGETFSAKSAQSVASIMWLNETLPPFMTRDYILAPFGPAENANGAFKEGNWTGTTLKYSVNVNCETPISYLLDSRPMINSTWGCNFRLPLPDVTTNTNASKVFSTLYAGFFNEDGLADYYLSGYCPKSESNSFLIQWSQTLASVAFNGTGSNDFTPLEQLEHFKITTLYCRSTYNVEEVEATVRLPTNEVLAYRTTGQSQPLSKDIFNTSNFEASMSMGHERFRIRTDFPTTNWPSQTAFLTNIPLDLRQLSTMAPFAIGASQLPLEEYLDPDKLGGSYQSAYRLLFSRQMVDVLSRKLDPESRSSGQWKYQSQSVILVPAFTYIAEGLLIISTMFTLMILFNSRTRTSRLSSDPATIAMVMSLTADDAALLDKLRLMDQASEKELEFSIRNRRFRLGPSHNSGSYRLQLLDLRGDEPLEAFNDELQATMRQKNMQSLREGDEQNAGVVKGVQPMEFKAKMGLVFLTSQVVLLAVIAALFITIQKNNGLPLPSSSRFVRQLLENYVPTAIGTFIEPFWVLLNRHLCFLQPFDELRQGRRKEKRSLNLEYSSLPPQLTIFKALANGNVLLGIVCTMALLANGLAVSLSGLFFENIVDFGTAASFTPTYSFQFNPLDGEAAPFISERKQSLESVYIATSNRTASTPLPPWTDSQHFYFPFDVVSRHKEISQIYRARTATIGAQLACQPISGDSQFTLTGTQRSQFGTFTVPGSLELAIRLRSERGKEIECIPRGSNTNKYITFGQPTGPSAFEFFYALDGTVNSSVSDASFCREHIAAGWVRAALVNGTLSTNETNLDDPVPTVITSHNETIVSCRSTLIAGSADVRVSADGHVQVVYSTNTSTTAVPGFLSTLPSDLLGQVHQILLEDVEGIHWHNDSMPSDFINYLIEQATNSSAHLDPTIGPPLPDSIIPPLGTLYSQLFATLVGRNMDQLLKPAPQGSNNSIIGTTIQATNRVFMSGFMFVLAESILALYIVVTISLYMRRPWRILCRMPTSLASVIGFFAASHVVEDFRGTTGLTNKQLKQHAKKLNHRYGFGTFIGTDGKTHVGIEKHPFLAPLRKKGQFDRRDSPDSKQTIQKEWRSKFMQWKSGKVREGGWI